MKLAIEDVTGGVPILIEMDATEPGVFLNSTRVQIGQVDLHIEAIEVRHVKDDLLGAAADEDATEAVNEDFQNRIVDWLIRNDGCSPELVEIDGKKYFINVEVYSR